MKNHYEIDFGDWNVDHGRGPSGLLIGCTEQAIPMPPVASSQLIRVNTPGNVVPTGQYQFAELLRFSLSVMGVRAVLVCGHTIFEKVQSLGGMRLDSKAPFAARLFANMRHRNQNLKLARSTVLEQLDRLRTYELVAQAEQELRLELYGLVYLAESGLFLIYDPIREDFVPLIEQDSGFFGQLD